MQSSPTPSDPGLCVGLFHGCERKHRREVGRRVSDYRTIVSLAFIRQLSVFNNEQSINSMCPPFSHFLILPHFFPDLWHNWNINFHNYLSQCGTHFSDFITAWNL